MITIKNLTKEFEGKKIIDNYNLKVDKGQRVLIKGDSGIGKTTILRCIAGLEDYEGTIDVDGSLAYIFQENRFMPWLSIKDNLLLPFKMRDMNVKDVENDIIKVCKDLEVYEHINKYPEEVSGGQIQRLSLVQGLIMMPDSIIMDEPLKSLEGLLYIKLYQYILTWSKKNNVTLIYVTHEKVDENDFNIISNIK